LPTNIIKKWKVADSTNALAFYTLPSVKRFKHEFAGGLVRAEK